MSDSRPIQKYQKGGLAAAPAGTIMTAQGPATIQIIDMHSPSDLAVGGGPPRRKVGGINIVGAVLRRWWLVALITLTVGGGAWYVGKKVLTPVYEASVQIRYSDPNESNGRGPIKDLVVQGLAILNARDIPLMAAHEPELQEIFPALVGGGRDLNDPAVQADVLSKLSNVVDSEVMERVPNVVRIFALQPNPVAAQKIANAYSRAFVAWCKKTATAKEDEAQGAVLARVEMNKAALEKLIAAENKLKGDYDFAVNKQKYDATLQQITKIKEAELTARVDYAAAERNAKATRDGGVLQRRPKQELASIALFEEEKKKDTILQAYSDQLIASLNDYNRLTGVEKKTEDHPDVQAVKLAMARARENIAARDKEIHDAIDGRIQKRFDAEDKVTVADAEELMRKANDTLKRLESQLQALDKDARTLGEVQVQIDKFDRDIGTLAKRQDVDQGLLDDIERNKNIHPTGGVFEITQLAPLPDKPKEDKRVKVQAAGMVGGLFLGILLALLIDRFDKRLRDPRDIEVMLNVPLLGTIPKIQELKRIKGDQARNLIAEEFRIIRTQVLFGNPELQYKILAVVSPTPGDGKTSLAVNLAISIAKAGRRVLLVDGDLRKPDVHRVFNIPDSPGFAEVISGGNEPAQVIRKSDIDGLDILAAGTPLVRPSELLSRPEVARTLAALSETYDHIVIDTAPLLPVSDTHVLIGMVDACICSFNAEVDRDTVNMTQDILKRCRANVIGSVMNQVKYKQSGSFHRGKSAYDSYYNSSRGAPAAKPAALDPGVATLGK